MHIGVFLFMKSFRDDFFSTSLKLKKAAILELDRNEEKSHKS